jgi:hypothetical protein
METVAILVIHLDCPRANHSRIETLCHTLHPSKCTTVILRATRIGYKTCLKHLAKHNDISLDTLQHRLKVLKVSIDIIPRDIALNYSYTLFHLYLVAI